MAARKTSKPKSTLPYVKEDPKETKVGNETVLIFQANKPLSIRAFNAAAEMLRSEQKETGLKIVLIPNSVEQKE